MGKIKNTATEGVAFDELEEGFIFKWRTIGAAIGINEWRVRRVCRRIGLHLYRWGDVAKGATFLPREHVAVLFARVQRANMRYLLTQRLEECKIRVERKKIDRQ